MRVPETEVYPQSGAWEASVAIRALELLGVSVPVQMGRILGGVLIVVLGEVMLFGGGMMPVPLTHRGEPRGRRRTTVAESPVLEAGPRTWAARARWTRWGRGMVAGDPRLAPPPRWGGLPSAQSSHYPTVPEVDPPHASSASEADRAPLLHGVDGIRALPPPNRLLDDTPPPAPRRCRWSLYLGVG
jgi:hypothetical protein